MEMLLFCIVVLVYSFTPVTNKLHHDCHSERDKLLVDCSSRGLKSVPNNIDNTTKQLYLNINQISSLTSKVFVFLGDLKSMDLSNNKITHIHREAFYGLWKLSVLSLEDNLIDTHSIQNGALSFLSSLKTLNVRSNPYWTVKMDEESEISKVTSLENLIMDACDTIKFSKYMRQLQKLRKLDIAFNNPYLSGDESYVVENESFDTFSNSSIEEVILFTSYIDKDALCRLTNLKTASLHISTLQDVSIDIFKIFHCFRNKKMKRIEISGISYNNGFTLNGNNLKYLTGICLKELVLSNNFIRDIGRYFRVFTEKSKCLELLDLSNNPLYGKTPWAFSLFRLSNIRVIKLSYIGTVDSINDCSRVNVYNFVFNLAVPNTLEEIYVTDIKTIATIPTTVNITGANSLRLANFSFFSLCRCNATVYGLNVLKMIDISGWHCHMLNPRLTANFPKLEVFVAKNSYLGSGFKMNENIHIFFQNNTMLKRIDLSNNDLSNLPANLFSKQHNSLIKLILRNNSMKRVPIYINNFPKLTLFDISFNSFTEFSEKEQLKFKTNREIRIRLEGNPLHCMCRNLQFLKWANKSGISDFMTSQCLGESGFQVPMKSIITNIDSFEKHCQSKFWIAFAISLTSIVIAVILISILYYRYRYTIDYLLVKIRLKLRKYKPLINEEDYQFDAFISHSHKDLDTVMTIYRKLSDKGFSISLDAKDFIAGRFIAENVVDVLGKSRKILFVISNQFLESQWGFYELEMTRMHAYRENRQNMVIVIIKDGIGLQRMPSVLREMWSKITCVEWPTDTILEEEESFYNSVSLALQN